MSQFWGSLHHPSYPATLPRARYAIGDIGPRGRREVLFVYCPPIPEESHVIYAFKADRQVNRFVGPEVIGRFQVGRAAVVGPNPDKDQFPPPYKVWTVKVIPGHQPLGSPKIVVSSYNNEAPDQVAVLDSRLRLVGEYWHPGHLPFTWIGELSGDKHPDIVLAGVNNGYHAATLIVFDAFKVWGTAKILPDPRFEIASVGMHGSLRPLPKGSEKCVVIFPMTCLAAAGQPYNRVVALRVNNEQIEADVIESTDEHDPKNLVITYKLNHKLQVVEVAPQPPFRDAHLALEKNRILNHPFSPADVELIRKRVSCRCRSVKDQSKDGS